MSDAHGERRAITDRIVDIGGQIRFGNQLPLVIVGGLNVLEDEELALEVAGQFRETTRSLGLPFVFKASFDKANRSSIGSYRGPGLEAGLRILDRVKQQLGVPILTDVHEPAQASAVAEVADILQLPAFLARQTDLVTAIARTGRPVNVKKPQFLAPQEMEHILDKLRESGNDQAILCERGTAFGYNNLVVDMLGVDRMKAMAPVMFDVTHALQIPGGRPTGAGGRRGQAPALARSAVALGIAGLFIETHPDPASARCDGESAIPLAAVRPMLEQIATLDRLVKSLPPLPID